MARLIYFFNCSLDGYIEDGAGNFDWTEPSEEVLDFINQQEREIGTYLYGRRIYETMSVWENDPAAAEQSPKSAEYAEIWCAADKIVYSTTLERVCTKRTRLERDFDPEAVRKLKAESGSDLSVFGPNLAGQAFRAGLVDQLRLMVVPVIVGGGKSGFPSNARADLDLADERRFGNGIVHLRYNVTSTLGGAG
jgi:dihydrofolate reductase